MDNSKMTRRTAMAATGAGAAAFTYHALRQPPRKTRASRGQIRYGVIGTGDRGSFLLRRLESVDNGRCVALCDIYRPNLDAAAALVTSGKPKLYTDYRELLANNEVDAVLVATPLHVHFEPTRDALLAGKHVFCEKSVVFLAEEVHALRALVNGRPRQVFQAGLQRRYSPFYQTAIEMIRKGLIGDVTHIRAQWHRNGAGRRPVVDKKLERQINWRFYREYSGGLTAELASHQMDVADWVFGTHPEFVCGVGGIDYWKDGRETYDNINLIFKYPKGQKLLYSAILTNGHMDILRGARPMFAESIMGTGGTIEITVGDAANPAVGPALGVWYREPNAPKAEAGKTAENWVAGATVSTVSTKTRGLPLLLPADQISSADSFLAKEAKFARRWLYKNGITMPEEERNPVEISLDDFFRCCMEGGRPLADVETGLWDSTGVILANLAMDEGRRVFYHEIDGMGRSAS
ncbi:MAG TPA: gfo/Idh/MocA family oxidoreductase [Solibacterales bacterium]|nr:gfo/Idh/MocA family oxidoreductase [Bryobacterales bacterium]